MQIKHELSASVTPKKKGKIINGGGKSEVCPELRKYFWRHEALRAPTACSMLVRLQKIVSDLFEELYCVHEFDVSKRETENSCNDCPTSSLPNESYHLLQIFWILTDFKKTPGFLLLLFLFRPHSPLLRPKSKRIFTHAEFWSFMPFLPSTVVGLISSRFLAVSCCLRLTIRHTAYMHFLTAFDAYKSFHLIILLQCVTDPTV